MSARSVTPATAPVGPIDPVAPITAADRAGVRELLGREPQGEYEIVVRRADGDPVVLRNAPILGDGTPMPTRYWLMGEHEHLAVSRLESTGGVRQAEAEIDPGLVADAHRRYAAEQATRSSTTSTSAPGHRAASPAHAGRVKCLHAHFAWFLAGGDDPVGRWVADRLASPEAPTS